MEYTQQQFSAGQVLRASQLNAMDAAIRTSMKSALPVEINFGKYSEAMNGTFALICAKGLERNTQYAIQLFRWSRSKHEWVTMWDEDRESSNFGWAQLCGKIRTDNHTNTGSTYSYFTDEIPDWMPNGGYLQSRWLFTTSDTDTKQITFQPKYWIRDALKPRGSSWDASKVALIGAKAGEQSSLRLKAGILQKKTDGSFELVGMSKSVLNVYFRGGNSSGFITAGSIPVNIRIEL